MKDGPNIVRIAALVGDHARAEILTALMGGEALTATELAGVAGVTKQTVSTHLAKLVDARLLAMESQGRHRYFRLADRDVADLLESLMGVAYRAGAVRVRSSPREPALRKARVCYDHLAGDLGVLVFDSLDRRRWLRSGGATRIDARRSAVLSRIRHRCRFARTGTAAALPRAVSTGACVAPPSRRSRRRRGLRRCLALGWARRAKGSRVVVFSDAGERALRERFSVPAR
jgi:DNA-binding transcriptional ArsR family regulator